jgi:photosystem II stability/assembly factor-like uncharacterized protein
MRSHQSLFACWFSFVAGRSRRLGGRFLLPILSVLILLCPSLSRTAVAGVNAWTTNGPEGRQIFSLAIDPTNPATLYAGTSGGGVFKSSDGGGSWTAVNTGLDTTFVITALVVDPAAPAKLYAGTGLGLVSGDASGVFKSTNGGQSWTAVNAGLTSVYGSTPPSVFALAIDSSAPATLYASTYGGVFKTTNGGGSWRAINTGLTGTGNAPIISALAIDPSAPATIYAGSGYNNEFWFGSGVFKSTNGGVSWSRINAGLTDSSVFSLAMDPFAPATLYAGTAGGVFRSTNGGGNWSAVNTGLTSTDVTALAIDPSAPATLYAGTSRGGVFKSHDSGGSWTAMNAGLANSTVNGFAIGRSAPASLHAATGSGVYDHQVDMASCLPDPTTLCLNNGRFKVATRWATRDGTSGDGQVIALTADTGAFWFFGSSNVEMMVKVLNGCGTNSRYWTFAGGLTDVDVTLTVTDTQTGTVRTYVNPQGTPFRPIQDTTAFATCP